MVESMTVSHYCNSHNYYSKYNSAYTIEGVTCMKGQAHLIYMKLTQFGGYLGVR